MKKQFAFTLAVCIAFAAGVVAGPPRDVTFDVRDAESDDVTSVCIARHPEGGLIETWDFVAYTSGDVPIETVTFQQVVTTNPRLNQLEAIITAWLNQLSARLDEKYPSSGPPTTLVAPGNGKASKP